MSALFIDEWNAQDRLEELIDEAQLGRIIVITRNGRPVAVLRPYSEETGKIGIPADGAK